MKRLVENKSVGIVTKENTVESFKDAIENSLKQKYAEITVNVYTARKNIVGKSKRIFYLKCMEISDKF